MVPLHDVDRSRSTKPDPNGTRPACEAVFLGRTDECAKHALYQLATPLLDHDRRRHRLGGARRDRTDDLMLAKHALYQLSYGPKPGVPEGRTPESQQMVGLGRLELPTSRLSSARSNQLSYKPQASRRRKAPPRSGAHAKNDSRQGSSEGRKRNEGGGVPHDAPRQKGLI